jgi:hypothetical protein
MADNLKCPFSQAYYGDNGSGGQRRDSCIKEDCALWLEDVHMCSFRELALETRYLQHRIGDIKEFLMEKP